MQNPEFAPTRPFRLLRAPAAAIVLWTCLWFNLNTGFWMIVSPTTGDEWQLTIRALLPFAVLPVAIYFLLIRKTLRLPWKGPSRLLMVYGCLAALASIFNPEPWWSAYWSMTYLATIFTAWTFLDQREPVESTRQLLQITWIASFVVAAIIGYKAQNAIFGHSATAYGLVTTDLQGLSRASGVARWAAVPGLVCLVRAFHSRRKLMIPVYLGIAGVAFFIVYRMQSRGAVFGAVAALLFALVVGSRLRQYALPFVLMATVVVLLLDSPATVSDDITTYLERGQTKENFESMSGRTRAYENGLAAFEDAFVLGRGQWADRLIINEHVHNSYLQALMNAGVMGGIPYFASWGAGWILFFRLHKMSRRLSQRDRICVLEAGTVMMFFTVRSIPETTTASYAVDLLVMVAVYVYLEALAASTARRSIGRLTPIVFRANSQEKVARLQPTG